MLFCLIILVVVVDCKWIKLYVWNVSVDLG